MNASLLRTAVSTSLLLTATLAFADHNIRRDLEDNAFATMTQAREIRTEVRDHFVGSASYGRLVDEATKLYVATRSIEDALISGRNSNAVCREIDQTLKALRCFRGNLEASDFAQIDPDARHPTHRGNGYSLRVPSRNPGYVHVVAVRQMIANLEHSLDSLHDDLSLLSHVQPVLQAPLPQPLPAVPHPGHGGTNSGSPVGPFLPPPSAGRSRSTVEVPVSFGNRGGIVFRFPMN